MEAPLEDPDYIAIMAAMCISDEAAVAEINRIKEEAYEKGSEDAWAHAVMEFGEGL